MGFNEFHEVPRKWHIRNTDISLILCYLFFLQGWYITIFTGGCVWCRPVTCRVMLTPKKNLHEKTNKQEDRTMIKMYRTVYIYIPCYSRQQDTSKRETKPLELYNHVVNISKVSHGYNIQYVTSSKKYSTCFMQNLGYKGFNIETFYSPYSCHFLDEDSCFLWEYWVQMN